MCGRLFIIHVRFFFWEIIHEKSHPQNEEETMNLFTDLYITRVCPCEQTQLSEVKSSLEKILGSKYLPMVFLK